MLFSKSNIESTYDLKISNIPIINSELIKDLGIYFQNNLKFDKHIESIIIKAKRKVNYVKFACRDFKNIQLLKNIYNTLIKSILNYVSVIWNTEKKLDIEKLEKIQHIFLRFLSYKTRIPMSFIDHNYNPIMNLINITSLQNSRAINDLKFYLNYQIMR